LNTSHDFLFAQGSGSANFRLIRRRGRLPGHIPALSPWVDIPFRHDLLSFMTGGWQNRCEDARSAIVAENEFFINLEIFNPDGILLAEISHTGSPLFIYFSSSTPEGNRDGP
jgi:hypothetical protein